MRATVATSVELMLISVFALVFRKVELPGEWNKVSRTTLGDALPVLNIIIGLLVIVEICGLFGLQLWRRDWSAYATPSPLRRILLQFVTGFARVCAPIVVAVIVVAHS